MAPGSQVGLRPAVLGDLQVSIKIYGWGRVLSGLKSQELRDQAGGYKQSRTESG